MNYLVLPILVEWRFGNGNLKGFLNAGGFGAILLSAESIFANARKSNNKDKFKPTDFGLAFGIGAIYKLREKLNVTIDLGGQLGKNTVNARHVNNYWRSLHVFSGNIGLLFAI